MEPDLGTITEITLLLTVIRDNETLTWVLHEAIQQNETRTASLETKAGELRTQNETLVKVVKQNETRTANLEIKMAQLEIHNTTIPETTKKSTITCLGPDTSPDINQNVNPMYVLMQDVFLSHCPGS